MKNDNPAPHVEEQIAAITRGSVQIVSEEELRAKLANGKPLTVKLGCDPSRPDLHLGHMVVLKKVRDFQDLGHKAVLIIGDFTATIGDPTGVSESRPQLSLKETQRHGQTYLQQAAKVLDMSPKKLTVRYNSEWLAGMDLAAVIRLAADYTVARMLERDDFHTRLEAGKPVGVHEFLYPLLQGFDSVALGADVEIGGTDQTFNLLVGRDLQRRRGLPTQVTLSMPLLCGLDGVKKMSKSLGNYVGLTDPPELMYEKLMRVPDTLLDDYVHLLTDLDLTPAHINQDPLHVHRELAASLVTKLHGPQAVTAARARYAAVAAKRIPEQIPRIGVPASMLSNGAISIAALAVCTGLCTSNSDVRRLVAARGLKVDGQVVDDPLIRLSLEEPVTLQKGKNKFALCVLLAH